MEVSQQLVGLNDGLVRRLLSSCPAEVLATSLHPKACSSMYVAVLHF